MSQRAERWMEEGNVHEREVTSMNFKEQIENRTEGRSEVMNERSVNVKRKQMMDPWKSEWRQEKASIRRGWKYQSKADKKRSWYHGGER